MKKSILLFLFLLETAIVNGQVVFQNDINDITILEPINDKFFGISAIEYIPKSKQWILASDQRQYFIFKDCKKASDFKVSNVLSDSSTDFNFESLRYDPDHDAYFFSVETDTETAVYYTYGSLKSPKIQLIRPLPLPVENKGIEGIALTPSGALWVAPEAGWEGEKTTDAVHFLKYENPLAEHVGEPKRYKYPIKRWPNPGVSEDEYGGISEILAGDETHLLVLERCYFSNPDRVIALLRNVTVDEENKELVIEKRDVFDFASIPELCNIEGMSWGDAEKKTLFIMADDGLGKVAYSKRIIEGTNKPKKPTLRNQMIILKRE